MSVRVRFAPSPTGRLHVGALRTALFDFLFARRHGGANILRIEDTDRPRYSEDAEREQIAALEWAGVVFDEGPHVGGPHAPYRQSERKAAGVYEPFVEQLLTSGQAYWAFDSKEELEEMRRLQELNKRPVGYFGGDWREASASAVEKARSEGRPGVVRLKMPRGRKIVFEDAIRGRIEWESDTLDDPVLIKADKMPTYHFAAIVDDHLMEITHVIRGEEWISSAPKHVWLIEALGWQPPVWVHCPVIVGTDGKKLSKRHGATNVLDYRAMGFLPEALLNFVALIGWSPGGDREIMPGRELIEAFALEGLQPSSGRFDFEKLKWMNGNYIRLLSKEALVGALASYCAVPENLAYWKSYKPEPGEPSPVKDDPSAVPEKLALLQGALDADPAYAEAAVLLSQERADSLADFGEGCAFFFQDEPPMDAKAVEKWFGQPHVRGLFEAALAWLSAFGRHSSDPATMADSSESGPSSEACEAFLREYADRLGLEKLGPVVHPMRVALTGKTTGPGLFELMSVLGRERMVGRLQRALALVAAMP